jgi:hypothetical protein
MSILSRTRAIHAGAALLLLCGACRDETLLPSGPTEEPIEADTEALPAEIDAAPVEPVDSGAAVVLERRSRHAGVAFGSWRMTNSHLDRVHTGWLGGSSSPKNLESLLRGARGKGGRVVIKLAKGGDKAVKQGGRFSLTKWKAAVSQYRRVNLRPYIQDGTIIGHYLIDEPHRGARWGGNGISRQTLEEMARFSKELWPEMTTIVRVAPSWLAGASVRYRHLDAGWAQYRASHGHAGRWISSETKAAEREGLGLVVGLNVLDGGNGSSRFHGNSRRKWAMSAKEIREYGSALLGSRRACAFFSWTHHPKYYNRSDIRSAMADVSAKARNHSKTACKQ